MFKALYKEFLDSEKSCGFILMICVALSLLLANLSLPFSYSDFWHISVGGFSLVHIINDGFMT